MSYFTIADREHILEVESLHADALREYRRDLEGFEDSDFQKRERFASKDRDEANRAYKEMSDKAEEALQEQLYRTPEYRQCVLHSIMDRMIGEEKRRRKGMVPGSIWNENNRYYSQSRTWIVVSVTDSGRVRLRTVIANGKLGRRTETVDPAQADSYERVDPDSVEARAAVAHLMRLRLNDGDPEVDR